MKAFTTVYVAGVFDYRPGSIGGWAWAVAPDGEPHNSGTVVGTTEPRMALRAALEAIQSVPGDLIVASTSEYLVDCFLQGWWQKWLRNDWRGGKVANRDLWEPLIEAAIPPPAAIPLFGEPAPEPRTIVFEKVPKRSGDEMSDLVAALAMTATRPVGPASG